MLRDADLGHNAQALIFRGYMEQYLSIAESNAEEH